MYKCECGSTKFKAKMTTTADVHITTESCYPTYIEGTESARSVNFSGSYVCVGCGKLHCDINDAGDNDENAAECCICGNTKFFASQICYHDIIVDSNNNFLEDVVISESESPHGNYCCTKCGKEYEDLDELEKNNA